MNKITITLLELLQLESELNGFVNQQTKEKVYKGFINHNLPILLKYDLLNLSEFLSNERKKIESLRDELIKQYGKLNEDGNYYLNLYEDSDNMTKLSESYILFENDYNKLLSQEIEIEYPDITRSDLGKIGDTSDNYTIFFKLIKK